MLQVMQLMDTIVLTLIAISCLRGFSRGLFLSLGLAMKFIAAPFLMMRYGETIIRFLVEEWRLGQAMIMGIREMMFDYKETMDHGMTELTSISEQWPMLKEEALQYIAQLEITSFSEQILTSMLGADIFQALTEYSSVEIQNFADLILAYVGYGMAYMAVFSFIFLLLLFFSGLFFQFLFSFISIYQRPKEFYVPGFFDRFLGAMGSGFFSILLLSLTLVLMQPFFSFFSHEFLDTPVLNYFLGASDYIKPFMEMMLIDLFLGG